MKKSVLICSALLLLAGCDYDLPKVDAGSIRQMGDGTSTAQELTFLQVSEFSDWCARHRDGWKTDFTDYAPGILVTFRHKGSAVASANFTGSIIIIGGKSRSLTTEESKALHDILGIKNG